MTECADTHNLSLAFLHPAAASFEDVLTCWLHLEEHGVHAYSWPHQQTLWHVIASWSDYDWMKFELTVRSRSQNFLAFESWLDRLYVLNDEFKTDAQGRTPFVLASQNIEWPYLLDWWAFKRQTLERIQLSEKYKDMSLDWQPVAL